LRRNVSGSNLKRTGTGSETGDREGRATAVDMISEDLVAMLESGAGLLVGTVSADGTPRPTRAWGIRFEEDGRIRVVVSGDDVVTLDNLVDGLVAVTGADVRDFRSVQLKGRVLEVAPPDADDLELAARHTDLMFTAIHEVDHTEPELQQRLLPSRLVTIVVEPDTGFDQTPGPGAGSVLGSPS
jgi:hypothetical protein